MTTNRRALALLAFSAILILPQEASANTPLVSAALPGLVVLSFAYVIALLISRRADRDKKRKPNLFNILFTIISGIILVFFLGTHPEVFFYMWAFYIGIQFCMSLIVKDRVVHGSRREDLRWFGVWTAIIIASSVTAKVYYWRGEGGFRAYWNSMLEEQSYFVLPFYAIILPIFIVIAWRTGVRTGKPIAAESNAAPETQGENPDTK